MKNFYPTIPLFLKKCIIVEPLFCEKDAFLTFRGHKCTKKGKIASGNLPLLYR